MGLLLSILVECVGVLEVIACYQHFQYGLPNTDVQRDELLKIKRQYQREFSGTPFEFHDQSLCPTCKEELLEKLRQEYDAKMYPDKHKKITNNEDELSDSQFIKCNCKNNVKTEVSTEKPNILDETRTKESIDKDFFDNDEATFSEFPDEISKSDIAETFSENIITENEQLSSVWNSNGNDMSLAIDENVDNDDITNDLNSENLLERRKSPVEQLLDIVKNVESLSTHVISEIGIENEINEDMNLEREMISTQSEVVRSGMVNDLEALVPDEELSNVSDEIEPELQFETRDDSGPEIEITENELNAINRVIYLDDLEDAETTHIENGGSFEANEIGTEQNVSLQSESTVTAELRENAPETEHIDLSGENYKIVNETIQCDTYPTVAATTELQSELETVTEPEINQEKSDIITQDLVRNITQETGSNNVEQEVSQELSGTTELEINTNVFEQVEGLSDEIAVELDDQQEQKETGVIQEISEHSAQGEQEIRSEILQQERTLDVTMEPNDQQTEAIDNELDSINLGENVLIVSNGRSLSEPIDDSVQQNPSESAAFVIDYVFHPTPAHNDADIAMVQNDVGTVSNDFSSVVFNVAPHRTRNVMDPNDIAFGEELGTATDELSELSMFTESELAESGISPGALYIVDDGVTQRHVYIDRLTNSIVELIPDIQFDRADSSADNLHRVPSPYPPDELNVSRNELHIPDSLYETESNPEDDRSGRSNEEEKIKNITNEPELLMEHKNIEVISNLNIDGNLKVGENQAANMSNEEKELQERRKLYSERLMSWGDSADDIVLFQANDEGLMSNLDHQLDANAYSGFQEPKLTKKVSWADESQRLSSFAALMEEDSLDDYDSNIYLKPTVIKWDNSSSEELDLSGQPKVDQVITQQKPSELQQMTASDKVIESPARGIPSLELRSVSQESEYDNSSLPHPKDRANLPDFWNRTISSQNSSLDKQQSNSSIDIPPNLSVDGPLNSNVSVQEHEGLLKKQITLSTTLRNRLSKGDSSVSIGSENMSFDETPGVVQCSINVQQKQYFDEPGCIPVYSQSSESETQELKESRIDDIATANVEKENIEVRDSVSLKQNIKVNDETLLREESTGIMQAKPSFETEEIISETLPNKNVTSQHSTAETEPIRRLSQGILKTESLIEAKSPEIPNEEIQYLPVLETDAILSNVDESIPYDEKFLNSLDGIKSSSISRDRRKNFKKRNSSSSSSRASRDEELKMLTSLEEKEQGITYDQMMAKSTESLDGLGTFDKRNKRKKRNHKADTRKTKSTESLNVQSTEGRRSRSPNATTHSDTIPEEIKVQTNDEQILNIPEHEQLTETTQHFSNDDEEQERYQVEQAHLSFEKRRNLRQLTKVASFEDATKIQHKKMLEQTDCDQVRQQQTTINQSEVDRHVTDKTEKVAAYGDHYDSPRNSSENAFWLIFSGEYTKAMNKEWHGTHFCCWQCDESLTGQRYVLRDDHPYCVACYESVFANTCEECGKIIGIDSKDLSYKDKHWHEACFLCSKCRVSLVDKQFGSKLDKIYCGNCYDAQFASRCDGCGEIFRAGTKKMEYKTRQWHEKCFCCCVCKTAIGTKSFIPREQEIYCAQCYEEKFATRCVKCNKIITSGGVTYKNEPWHRECFTCFNCNTSLAGQRFTSRDDKPYCAECFGELFAKRCTACSKPITGIGGTRFISFEERHWHNDCFVCASCKTSLVGRGFITDEQDIICPDCAKQRLM